MKPKKKSENTLRQATMKTHPYKNLWDKNSSKREAHNDIGLPQETRKISNKQPNLPPKIFRGEKKTKIQSHQDEGSNKN